jgi:predicted RNA-binding protein
MAEPGTPVARYITSTEERDAVSYLKRYDDNATQDEHVIGHTAYAFKRRLELAQDEWELMKMIYNADMPTKKKRRLTDRMKCLKTALVNSQSDQNVHNRRAGVQEADEDSD